jgi:single-strand DNA-binding protein
VPTTSTPSPSADVDRNDVHLVGRVTSPPERRGLPSGDEVVVLRVTVRRPTEGADTLRISVGPAPPSGTRRRPGQVGRRHLAAVHGLEVGDRVEVTGRLTRRWWAAQGARRSLVEVRADEVARLSGP